MDVNIVGNSCLRLASRIATLPLYQMTNARPKRTTASCGGEDWTADLELALQENLKLRRELGTKVAKANGSSFSKKGEVFYLPRMILKPLMILKERLWRVPSAP